MVYRKVDSRATQSADRKDGETRNLAGFELIRRLGAGGMAEVFLARRRCAEATYKVLVVKRILPEHISAPNFRAMFAGEARLATRLNHPNIVQVYDFQDAQEEGQLLSMEYVEGPDLGKVARSARDQKQAFPPFVAAHIAAEAGRGLHYAHERKDDRGQPLEIVHRDVSPQNILVSFDGAIKVADFGIAAASLFREERGVLKGKLGYMSPEQARGEQVDRRADIFSLGVVLYELLTGRPLYRPSEGRELLDLVRQANIEAPSVIAPGVPPELEIIVMRALSRNREDRFQTAREFAAAITRVLLEKQVLVDSDVVGAVIARFVSREQIEPESVPDSESTGSRDNGALPSHGLDAPPREGTSPSRARGRLKGRAGREVRHVAIVTLRLHELDALRAALGEQQSARLVAMLRSTLGEMAFKRGTTWSWREPSPASAGVHSAEAVVGLLANPYGAAADAGRLAVDVHEAIQGACDALPVQLAASVGIVRGLAAGRRDDAGHLVQPSVQESGAQLAALLAERAPPGQTWVAGGLYRVVRRDFIWSDVAPLNLSEAGQRLPRNLHAYALRRPLSREEKQQQALAIRDLIGRDAELADLHAAYHEAVNRQHGIGNIVARVIKGEIGIGKTALTSAFLAELPPGARLLRVDCSPAQRELPFYHIGQWLRELTGAMLDQPLAEAVALVGHALGEAFSGDQRADIVQHMSELATGRLAQAHDEADVAKHRRFMTVGFRRAFTWMAQQAPLVVVLDGVQWADAQSLEVLSGLVRHADTLPILFLLVTRPDDHVASLIADVVTIELLGLSQENQLRLVQEHLGVAHGVAEVCADLLPRAAGNPFFLLEMVDALLERGGVDYTSGPDGQQRLTRVQGSDAASKALPSTLEQLIADRLNELPAEEHRVIAWLAVAGGPLSAAELDALMECEAEETVARLCARGLCDAQADSVDLRHPLVRDVAYLGVEEIERCQMHCRLGERMAAGPVARGLGAAIVGRHFARGGDVVRAGQFFLLAATAAHTSYQLPLATRYFSRALAVLPDSHPERPRALEALENICRIQGRWKDRRLHLNELRRLACSNRTALWGATALVRSARFAMDSGQLAQALPLAQKGELAAHQSGLFNLEVESLSLLAEILRDLGDIQGALGACDRALAASKRSGVALRLRAEVLRSRGTLLLRVGRVQEAVNAHAEAIAVFKQTGAQRSEARAKNSLAFAMFVLGRFEDAIALSLEAIRIDLSIGGRFQIAKTLSQIGQCYWRLGDVQRAQTYLKRARHAHERYADQDGRCDTLLSSAQILIETGDLAGAEAAIGDASALIAATGNDYDSVHEKLVRALLARERGDHNSAVMLAFYGRQVAEAQAYVAFHFFAMAIEAAARVDKGEPHMGILLATTAMGAIETLQGSEYGLETRLLCCHALTAAASPQSGEFQRRASNYAQTLHGLIRTPDLQQSFSRRPLLAPFLSEPSWVED
ncbi:MAG: protein kinase [Deltaproteobacteria bacterium]